MKPEKTFAEFFAGIGLVREGLATSGWQCVYANDIDPKKQLLYESRFGPGDFHLEDVWKTKAVLKHMVETPFLATASFPCVDLSLAGHYRGLNGSHSSTFFGFVHVLEAMRSDRPKAVMLENVTGFITSNGGKDFEAAIHALAELGYWMDAFVLNAEHFVPQSRPRVFLVGVQEQSIPKDVAVQPEGDLFLSAWNERIEGTGSGLRPAKLVRLMQSIRPPTGWLHFELPTPPARRVELRDVLDVDDEQAWWNEQEVKRHRKMMSDRHRAQVDGMLEEGGLYVGTIFRRVRDGGQRAEIRFDGVAGCLRTPKGGSGKQIVIILNDGEVRMRWMSPKEYARLQGAGDFPISTDTIQMLRGFGDAVCVPAIEWIDRHVLTPIFDAATARKKKRTHPPRKAL